MSDIRAGTISDAAGTGPITMTKQSPAKAWGTPDSNSGLTYDTFNITSATDNGTGDVTLNLTSSMSNATYSVTATVYAAGGAYISNISQLSATALAIKSYDSSNTATNARTTAQALGDLA